MKDSSSQSPIPLPDSSRTDSRTPDLSTPKIIIAIDGYSACGKSTTAKQVAARMGYAYVDTGAMYRAVTLYFHDHYVALDSPKEVQAALNQVHIHFVHNPKSGLNETFLNGLNVEEEIRKMYISERVSDVSALPEVRKAMVRQQQEMGKKRGLVMDGRDIGTTVFPDAELKIFMSADIYIRAERRQLELLEKEQLINLEEIIANLQTRDRIDTSRKESPLVKAADAYDLDTSHLTIEQQVNYIVNLAIEKISALRAAKPGPGI